jgi:hypothetical protein
VRQSLLSEIMADVFVSYTKKDRALVEGIVHDLAAEGLTVFFDRKIPLGSAWDETIERELDRARAVIVVWTDASVASRWVRREARAAAQDDKLLPLICRSCRIPLEFSDLQSVDLTDRRPCDRTHAGWRQVVDAVRSRPRVDGAAAATRRRLITEHQIAFEIGLM